MVATRRPVSTRLSCVVVVVARYLEVLTSFFPSVLRFERGVGGLCKKNQVYYLGMVVGGAFAAIPPTNSPSVCFGLYWLQSD
jgi:hypothetical protein